MSDAIVLDERYWRDKIATLRGLAGAAAPDQGVVVMAGTLSEIADSIEEGLAAAKRAAAPTAGSQATVAPPALPTPSAKPSVDSWFAGKEILDSRSPAVELHSGYDGSLMWHDWFWADEIALTAAETATLKALGWFLDERDGREAWLIECGDSQGR